MKFIFAHKFSCHPCHVQCVIRFDRHFYSHINAMFLLTCAHKLVHALSFFFITFSLWHYFTLSLSLSVFLSLARSFSFFSLFKHSIGYTTMLLWKLSILFIIDWAVPNALSEQCQHTNAIIIIIMFVGHIDPQQMETNYYVCIWK